MERPIFQPLGTPALELDTPALVVDLDLMEQNIQVVHSVFDDSSAVLRPHVSCHGCPNIARAQVAARNAQGVAVSTVGEAEVFCQAGFDDVFVANQVVTRPKIRRLCALAHSASIAVAVDNSDNLALLSSLAAEAGVTLGLWVELDAGQARCGVAPGSDAVDLARAVVAADNVEFRGLTISEPTSPPSDSDPIAPDIGDLVQPVLETARWLEQTSTPVPGISVASSYDYIQASAIGGITEVQASVYPLGDHQFCLRRRELSRSARILASVLSHPVPNRAVVDAGHKATGPDLGVAFAEGIPGAVAARFSAEHGILDLVGSATARLHPNDKVWLTPYNLSLCVNQYDYFRAVRNGRLEGFWPIASRGRFD